MFFSYFMNNNSIEGGITCDFVEVGVDGDFSNERREQSLNLLIDNLAKVYHEFKDDDLYKNFTLQLQFKNHFLEKLEICTYKRDRILAMSEYNFLMNVAKDLKNNLTLWDENFRTLGGYAPAIRLWRETFRSYDLEVEVFLRFC